MLARVGAVIVEQDNPKYYLVSYRFSFFFLFGLQHLVKTAYYVCLLLNQICSDGDIFELSWIWCQILSCNIS